jgi:hypothetical protein
LTVSSNRAAKILMINLLVTAYTSFFTFLFFEFQPLAEGGQ